MAKIKVSNILKYVLFLGIGVVIFYFVYRDQELGDIWAGIKEFKIEWILISFVFSIISHIARALRWRMLIQPLGYSPGKLNTFLAILVMYLANFAFPRLGEVSRCGVLTRYEKVPFTQQLGTVVTERIFDVIMLLLILAVMVLAQFDIFQGFIENNRENIGFDTPLRESLAFWLILLGTALAIAAVVYLFKDKILNSKIGLKFKDLFKKFTQGLLSVRKLKNPGLFILYTVGIYLCYYLMTYAIIMGYDVSRTMGPMAVFAILAMGSVGMVIPVQGGIGTYHFFVIQTMLVLGFSKGDGQLVALVLHGVTTVFMIVIGLLALIILPLYNRKSHL